MYTKLILCSQLINNNIIDVEKRTLIETLFESVVTCNKSCHYFLYSETKSPI